MGVHAAFKSSTQTRGLLSVATSPSLAFVLLLSLLACAFSSALYATVFLMSVHQRRGQFFFHLLILFARLLTRNSPRWRLLR